MKATQRMHLVMFSKEDRPIGQIKPKVFLLNKRLKAIVSCSFFFLSNYLVSLIFTSSLPYDII